MILNEVLTGAEFEEYVRQLLSNDAIRTETTPTSNDYGADLICYVSEKKVAIQCKYYTKAVGVKAVQEVIGSLKFYQADFGVVVTNSFFTQQAANLASSNNVLLIDRNSLSFLSNMVIEFLERMDLDSEQKQINDRECYDDWTVRDLVIRYGVSSGKIYKDFLGNGLPYYKLGREYRFDPDEVIQWEIETKVVPYGSREEIILPGYIQFVKDLKYDYRMAKKEGNRQEISEIKRLKRKYHILFIQDKIIRGIGIGFVCIGIILFLIKLLK